MKSEDAMVVWTPLNDGTFGDSRRGKVMVTTVDGDDQFVMSEGSCDAGWREMSEADRQTKLGAMAKALIDEHGIDAAAVYQEFTKIEGWKL